MSTARPGANPQWFWPRKHQGCTESRRLRQTHTVAFGLARTVPENTPMVAFENAQYSVPAHLLGARVFVRSHGTGPDEQIIIVHHGLSGTVEVARHGRARPGPAARRSSMSTFPGPGPGPRATTP